MSRKDIADYALIGDCETAALINRQGTLEWLCFPRFDSEACCTALLGDEENGCWKIDVAGATGETSRRYRGDTLILETEIACETGRVRLIDFMPIRGEAPDVVRIVECLEGEAEVTSQLLLRFDYGRINPLVYEKGEKRAVAISGPDGVSLNFDVGIEFADRRFTSQFTITEGERRSLVLTWFPSHEKVPDRVDPIRALRDTEDFWADWLEEVEYHGEYRDTVVRSLITLKALIHRPTGGIIAAPTSSLPENPGGVRNWDYRYCWLRDATFTLLALTSMGMKQEAKAWIDWLRRATGGDPIHLQPFYTVTGDHRALEWTADWLSGFNGAQPVRFGNGAEIQLQLDVYGEVVDALYQAIEQGISDSPETLALIGMLADCLEKEWQKPDAGIWEIRSNPLHHTYSKVMCWAAFDRAAAAFRDHDEERCRRYRDLAREVAEEVLEKGFDKELNAFVYAFGSKKMDAAALRIPLVGFLPPDDPRVVGTVEAIERELKHGPLVRRYAGDIEDGLEGDEGAFVAASFWLADVYCMQGRKDDARAIFEGLLDRANDLGLLSEELALDSTRQLGNFPQGLSHLSLVGTAYRLMNGHGEDRPAQSE
ncbi:glycoside hydrolase family 15 protein [Altericroceibacterium xinjiangense]|uniref:glycoside hydrolase family 15 protein n=1 Tax=Altericroceibacterium xinjiangense TaxID=762261 RepID=UPI000F7F2338|nr:glycoside hydrolase family 15 protein [Altericroceibacterium xinjiangense]